MFYHETVITDIRENQEPLAIAACIQTYRAGWILRGVPCSVLGIADSKSRR